MAVGISGYGVVIPRLRIKREDYTKAWGTFAAAGVNEKSVLGFDEDILTLSAKVAKRALDSVPTRAVGITRFAFASTSAPYAEKLLSGTILTGLGAPGGTFASEHTTSTRAGTEAILTGFEHVAAVPGGTALVAIADAPTASMWDSLEHAMGAGAAGFVLARAGLIAELEGHASVVSEHLGERFRPKDTDRLRDLNVRKYNEGAFLANVTGASSALMEKLGRKPEDYAYVVIQQPDARAPAGAAGKLGFTDAQLATGLVSANLGDLGAASTAVGLAAVLDVAKVGDRVLVASYGSGAGSDALSFRVVGERKATVSVAAELARKEYVDYVQYLKIKGAIK